MLFNSMIFVLFAAVFFAAWPFMRRRNDTRWIYLTVMSLVFYGWWRWDFLGLLILNGAVNYYAALGMERWPLRRRLMLGVSLAVNLGTLVVFKYRDFGIANANWLLAALGAEWSVPAPEKVLPVVGISFYTFQAMSYTIDVYRGQLKPTHNIFHFFAFLSLFPQLVAGPIIRAATLLPQLETRRPTTESERWEAAKLIAVGFFRKMVVADTVAPVVRAAIHAQQADGSCLYWWAVMLLFTYQIYCDFSGYSDIARGLGRLMGYDFPVNFNHPYISASFREFWQRWHISLSTWFRDYVYIPLGGSKLGAARSLVCLWITMLVSGLWHGANWTFVAWGACHAFYLTIERFTRWPERLTRVPAVGRHVTVLVVFLLTVVSWVFFVSRSMEQAFVILGSMFNFANLGLEQAREAVSGGPLNVVLIMILAELWFHFRLDRARLLSRLGPTPERLGRRVLAPIGIALLLCAAVYLRGPGSVFIYFQF